MKDLFEHPVIAQTAEAREVRPLGEWPPMEGKYKVTATARAIQMREWYERNRDIILKKQRARRDRLRQEQLVRELGEPS